MHFPRCDSDEIYRHGLSPTKRERFRCQCCRRVFQLTYHYEARKPGVKEQIAHSNGDVALHAATDALLGAAALDDIGKLFPDTDPAFKGADSRVLLREAWRRIVAKGYRLGNLDITLIAQAPKMAPHIPKMRVNIAEDLGCYMNDVNVKATTTEQLGFTGSGEGIACEAVALLVRT
ncbi:2-C-methyl-D-erythritol 2,4-cyclodiphosphate synthase, partial [Sodalis-like symbiont of Philaenus spumarius]